MTSLSGGTSGAGNSASIPQSRSFKLRDALRSSLHPPWMRRGNLLISVLSPLVAFAAMRALQRYTSGLVTPLFFAAVMLSGWKGGLWPGLLTTLISAVSLDRILDPAERLAEHEFIPVSVFTLVSVAISVLNGLRRNMETELRQKQTDLEQRVTQRTAELNEAYSRVSRNVAQLEATQATLRESEENFRSLFENAPIAYHEIDREGIIRRTNHTECDLLGMHRDDLIGSHVWNLVSPSERTRSQNDVRAKLEGKLAIGPFRREFIRKDGCRLVLEIHENLIRNASGDIVGLRSGLINVTEKLEAEEAIRTLAARLEQRVAERTAELERSNEALQQFAYSASHDLQEPLRMVSSYTRLLEKKIGHLLDTDGHEFLFYVMDGARRMSSMINDLLAFSRAGTGDQSAIEVIDMNEVVSTSIRNLHAAIEESGAQVTRKELPPVCGRRAGLAQVLQNLVGNALKYRSEAAPFVIISGTRHADLCLFCVEDNGLGFSPEMADKVFGLFKRMHGNRYPGTGMGLAICKRIIERNGGEIWAESAPGKGSKFFFTLPAVKSNLDTGSKP